MYRACFFAVILVGIKDVSIETDFIRMFGKDTPIRQAADLVQEKLTGTTVIEFMADAGAENGIKNPQFMRDADAFVAYMLEKHKDLRHTHSILEVVKTYNELMLGRYEIPKTQEEISQYLFLYTLSLPQGMGIDDMMDLGSRVLRITFMANFMSENRKLEIVQAGKKWWEQHSSYRANATGMTVISAHMRNYLSQIMIYSIVSALILVTLVLVFVFKSPYLIALSVLSNVVPILSVVGLMGYLKINIDASLVIVFAIVIGVAIDSTIHFLYKNIQAQKEGLAFPKRLEYIFTYAGGAITFTTLILTLSFSAFLASNFAFYSNFGFVMFVTLALAYIFDMLLLPAALALRASKLTKPATPAKI
ncbi:MAG: efflux RND transporter permease subunit [Helicobacteraceae bacterium]